MQEELAPEKLPDAMDLQDHAFHLSILLRLRRVVEYYGDALIAALQQHRDATNLRVVLLHRFQGLALSIPVDELLLKTAQLCPQLHVFALSQIHPALLLNPSCSPS